MVKTPILWLCLCLNLVLCGQSVQDSLQEQLNLLFDSTRLAGLGVAIVDTSGIRFMNGYGYSDLEKKAPYTPQTIQNIASISKTFIGVSIMKAVEQGKLSLDDPVNNYLPFKIQNPFFPDVPILVRHLASHTSSLKDNDLYERSYILKESIDYSKKDLPKGFYKYYQLYKQNEDMSMEEFTKRITSSEGKWYKKKNYWQVIPGTKYSYSNVGAGLAALVLEAATGMTFPDYTQKSILDALDMSTSGWSFENVDMSKHSKLYFPNFNKIPRYSLITYPDGGMLTSIEDLSKYLINMMKGYVKGTELLSQTSCREMMRDHTGGDGYGLFWEYSDNGSIGHNGGDPGVATFMYFNPDTLNGQIMFTNTSPNSNDAYQLMEDTWNLLKKYSKRL